MGHFAGTRDIIFPLRFYDLGGASALIELWDARRANSPGELIFSLPKLAQRIEAGPCLPPAAFIFHCSRCGSTLLARLFAAAESNRVFDEPGALHTFRATAWANRSTPESQHALRILLEAHGLQPAPGERRLIVKLDSRAVFMIERLRACFPTVPFIYLMREPAEVVASLSATRPGFLEDENRTQLAAEAGESTQGIGGYSREEWLAWYVEKNLRKALDHAAYFSAVIDYATHATAYLEVVNRISQTSFSAADPLIMATSARHSKDVARSFDQQASLAKVSPATRATSERIAGPTYRAWRNLAAENR